MTSNQRIDEMVGALKVAAAIVPGLDSCAPVERHLKALALKLAERCGQGLPPPRRATIGSLFGIPQQAWDHPAAREYVDALFATVHQYMACVFDNAAQQRTAYLLGA